MQDHKKIIFRKKYLALRKSYSKTLLDQKTLEINKKLIAFISQKNFLHVGFYYAFANEVNLKRIFDYCLEKKINCYFPKIINDYMVFIKVTKETIFSLNKYQIFAPETNDYLKNINLIEVIFCPCVAFSKTFQRIGYGKGYYDKFLKNFTNLKVIVAFEFQKLEETILFTKNDIKSQLIVTEKQIYSCV